MHCSSFKFEQIGNVKIVKIEPEGKFSNEQAARDEQ